jgi:Cytochrome c554 and c-prime
MVRRSVAALLLAFSAGGAWAQSMGGGGSSALVWPAQGEYAGSRRCAVCHAAQARTYVESSMSRALEPIDHCEILTRNPRLTWSDGRFQYVIEKAGDRYRYTAKDGAETAEATLLYAFGQGKAGQTYVYASGGKYYESRVSYYQELKGLGLTVGAQNIQPQNIGQALGRLMSPGETRDCFGCHTTAARRGNELRLDRYENGVQCEDCHGPGAAHIASISDGKPKPGSIRGLKGMKAEETNDLCGSCHRTWETIMLLKIRGTSNVRFQPYRLTNSQCFLSGDSRIACTACHNPHAAPVTDAKAYDAKCTACHNTANSTIRKTRCKVATEGCVSCHMPRYEVPGSHHSFADHWIRVAKAGDPYPD